MVGRRVRRYRRAGSLVPSLYLLPAFFCAFVSRHRVGIVALLVLLAWGFAGGDDVETAERYAPVRVDIYAAAPAYVEVSK